MVTIARHLPRRYPEALDFNAGTGQVEPGAAATVVAGPKALNSRGWSAAEHEEAAPEEVGIHGRLERVPAMCFLGLVGYTLLTEERGDQAVAELAGALAALADRSSREHGGCR